MSEAHTKEWYENYAKENGLKLGEKADKVIEMVDKNDSYCPCKVALWKRQRPDELFRIVCPCEDHKAEVEKNGCCTCRLFFKDE